MFTGIVEAVGEVLAVEATDEGHRLRVGAPFSTELTPGDSVSVGGVCLTVEHNDDVAFTVFLARETLARSAHGELAPGDRVNLERAMPADGRFDGHLVQGHVDATTEVSAVQELGEDWEYHFAMPEGLEPYLVEKGSVAIDGISLTVASLDDATFSVAVIPTTYRETTLADRQPGDLVNIEVDVLAKYVERQLSGH